MWLLNVSIAVATLMGWVPWPPDFEPAARWIAWAYIAFLVVDVTIAMLIKKIEES